MPSTVRHLLGEAGLERDGVVAWNEAIPGPPAATADTGVYIVALTADPDDVGGALNRFPVSTTRVNELLACRDELTLDGQRPRSKQLADRLSGFWLRDEVVLYIGLAGPRKTPARPSALSARVRAYYKTPLGARSPHAGGWFIKTLSNLDELFVHYAYCENVGRVEDDLLGAFRSGLSPESREALFDPVNSMPFANLEYPKGVAKRHGIRGAKASKTAASAATAGRPRAPGSASSRPHTAAPSHRPASSETQPLTTADIAAGRIRVPREGKRHFPDLPSDVVVMIRNIELVARWNPRFGPPERSGVVSVGRDRLRPLVEEGGRLTIDADDYGVRLT